MQQQLDLGPVEISYAAALRGVAPRAIGQPFRYLRCGAMDAEEMIALAASNPEGEFIFVLDAPEAAMAAQNRAHAMRLANLAFLGLSLEELSASLAARRQSIAPVNYFCADLADFPAQHDQAMKLAQDLTAPGGLCALRYAPFAAPTDGLRFMASEFAPAMPPAQHPEFLQELKQLGHDYFVRHPADAAALAQAQASGRAEEFLCRFQQDKPPGSATLSTIAAMAAQNFSFVGDAAAAANYLEMTVPFEAQELLYALRDNPLYEIIKDFAVQRASRTDIWVRQPPDLSDNPARLFGNFFFGLAQPGQSLPASVAARGKSIDLDAPIIRAIHALMSVMPITIGDFLAHDSGRDFKPTDTVMAVQLLVACGIAAPMRGSFGGMGQADLHYPRLSGQYNQQLRNTTLKGAEAMLASTVAGRVLRLRLPEALVLQAVGRVGFEESADALMQELQRIAGNPDQAGLVFTADAKPEPDFAEKMIRDICDSSMLSWYALGILDAA